MPVYTFQLAAHLAGRAVSVVAAGGSDVVASGILDGDAKFVATLPVGDYNATAGTGYYKHSSAGTVDLGDHDGLLTEAVANSTFGRRRMYDVRDYMGADDIGAAVNRAITAAAADGYAYGKPGQVILPPGNWAQTTEIAPQHGVDLIGSGWGKTVLRPQGRKASISRNDTNSDFTPLRDVLFANFEIDGSEQSLESGSYDTKIKGFYLQRLLRVTLDHIYVHDTVATGVGNDFHNDCAILDTIATGCGRLNSGTQGGGAGIGIGTGLWVTEALLVQGCRTSDNKTNGLFFETQTGVLPLGARVVGHVAQRNGRHGIADAGLMGLRVMGGSSRKNTKSGFATYQGTITPGVPGVQGRIVGMDLRENTEHGVHFDWSGRTPNATFSGYEYDGSQPTTTVDDFGYTVESCDIRRNGRHGVHLQGGGARVLSNHAVRDCNVSFNDEAGVMVNASGAFDVAIHGNRINANGQDAAAAVRSGIHLATSTKNLSINGNRTPDRQTAKTQTYALTSAVGTMHRDAMLDGNDLRHSAADTNLLGAFTGTPQYGFNPGLPGSPGAVAPLLADSFARADNTSSLGSTDEGQNAATAWAVIDAGTGGQWGVTSNSAKVTGGTGNTVAAQETGNAGGTHMVTIASLNVAASGGLAFRVQDAANLCYIAVKKPGGTANEYAITKRTAGSNAVMAGGATGVTPAVGDVLRVVDDGTTVKLYVNGTLAATTTDTAFATNTKAGLHGNFQADPTTRYRDWSYSTAKA